MRIIFNQGGENSIRIWKPDDEHYRTGLLGPGADPAGLLDAEHFAAIGAATQMRGAGFELEVEIAAGAVAVVVGELHL